MSAGDRQRRGRREGAQSCGDNRNRPRRSVPRGEHLKTRPRFLACVHERPAQCSHARSAVGGVSLIGKGSAAFLLLAALVASAGSAAAAPGRVSSNWAGYAVTGAGSGSTDVPAEFTSVSGTWVVPKAT